MGSFGEKTKGVPDSLMLHYYYINKCITLSSAPHFSRDDIKE
jgi:hypothetical protein